MDISINNEVNNSITNKKSNEVKDFVKELEEDLENPRNNVTIDKSLYNEIYEEMELAPKYKDQLEEIIKDSILDYSYDSIFAYVNYDEKSKKYYVDIYNEEIYKLEATKKDIADSGMKVGAFYDMIGDAEYFIEEDYIKDNIKREIEYRLNSLEEKKNRRKND